MASRYERDLVHNYFRRPRIDYGWSYDDVHMMFEMLVPVFVAEAFVASAVGNKTAAGCEQSDNAG